VEEWTAGARRAWHHVADAGRGSDWMRLPHEQAMHQGLYQESRNQAIFLRGMDIVAKADAAASAKVRERLGMSLPNVHLPPH